ncbi:hypothetical protein Tco_1562753 [Tanacetum coccineum]
MVKREVEIETLGECVDEIDKLAELNGNMKSDQHCDLKPDKWCLWHSTISKIILPCGLFINTVPILLFHESYKYFSASVFCCHPPERSDFISRVVIETCYNLEVTDTFCVSNTVSETIPKLPAVVGKGKAKVTEDIEKRRIANIALLIDRVDSGEDGVVLSHGALGFLQGKREVECFGEEGRVTP